MIIIFSFQVLTKLRATLQALKLTNPSELAFGTEENPQSIVKSLHVRCSTYYIHDCTWILACTEMRDGQISHLDCVYMYPGNALILFIY